MSRLSDLMYELVAQGYESTGFYSFYHSPKLTHIGSGIYRYDGDGYVVIGSNAFYWYGKVVPDDMIDLLLNPSTTSFETYVQIYLICDVREKK